MKQTSSDKLIKRINSAVESGGIKLAFIAEKTGITYYRIASVVNTESYRSCTKFTDKEVTAVNKVLDDMKKAI